MTDTLAEEWVGTTAAARRFGVAAETIRNWARKGQFPYRRLPSGQLRFEVAAIDRWLAGQDAQSAPQPVPPTS